MNSVRIVEMVISKDNLESNLETSGLLHAFGILNRGEEAYDIELDLPDVIPVKFKLQEATTQANGKAG